jgi:hypothetical protein
MKYRAFRDFPLASTHIPSHLVSVVKVVVQEPRKEQSRVMRQRCAREQLQIDE